MHVLPSSVTADRLEIREWTPADVDQMDAAISASVEHLRPWMPWIAFEPASRDDRLERIRTWQLDRSIGGDAVYAIFLDGLAIGGTGLHRRIGEGGLEIGYWIHVDHIRRGHAREASRALTVAAFELAEIDRVEIHHDRANQPSGRVPRSLGYSFIGEVPRPPEAPAESGVHCVWRITREEFETSWIASPVDAGVSRTSGARTARR